MLLATTALAQTPPRGDRSSIFYEEALTELKSCQFAAVIDNLQKSIRARPTGRAHLLLGRIYMQIEQLDNAEAAFQIALQVLPRLSPQAKTVTRLLKEIGVRKRTQLKVTTNPPGASVYLDWVPPMCDGECADAGGEKRATASRDRRSRASATPTPSSEERTVDLILACPRGKTPIIVSTTPGSHRVVLKGDNNYDQLVLPEIFAVDGRVEEVNQTLNPKGCDLALSILPADTVVEIDKAPPLATPSTVRLTPGEHELRFRKPGFQARSRAFLCKDFAPGSIIERLPPNPTGLITFRKLPSNVKVIIDDKPVPAVALPSVQVPVGQHQIEVTASGFKPWRRPATIEQNQDLVVSPELEILPVYIPPKPVYKKAWLWAVIGSAVAGGAGGITVWQTREPSLPETPTLGIFRGK